MPAQWRQLQKQLLRDKKKLGIMLGLLAVALVLWGRLMTSYSPPAASAQLTPQAAASASDAQPAEAASSKSSHAASAPSVSIETATPLRRNLFAFDPHGYRPTKDPDFASSAAKSNTRGADEQVRLAAVRQAAAGLTLQSVITGSQPQAVINGRMVAIGDKIHGFTLKKILDRQAVLEMDGIIVRLGM